MFLLSHKTHGEALDRLMTLCKQHQLTIATGESCTGGILGGILTYLPGSSSVYLGGVNAYSNQTKRQLLGIPTLTIEKHGAVSKQVAEAMARGARDLFSSTYGIAVTGIAGPDGGTPTKPVGTIWLAWAGDTFVESKVLNLRGDRHENRSETCLVAIESLSQLIERG